MKAVLTNQVERMLRSIASHAELVCEGLEGVVMSGDSRRSSAIDALVSAGALRPEEPGAYLLNPRLRAFVQDHLAKFTAFTSLTEIDPYIDQLILHRSDLRKLSRQDEHEDVLILEARMVTVVADLAYDIDRNLIVLNSNLSSHYGNVSSFRAKVLQNDFYQGSVKRLNRSLEKLRLVAQELKSEAVSLGALTLEVAVRRNLLNRHLAWTQQVNQAQKTISLGLFRTKQQHERLSRLTRVALWLRQNGAMSVAQEVDPRHLSDPALWSPIPIKVRSNMDPSDAEEQVQAGLAKLVASLPSREQTTRLATPPMQEVITCLADDDGEPPPARPAHEAALVALVELARRSPNPVSMAAFLRQSGLDLHEEDWLLYAPAHVRASNLEVDYVVPRAGAGGPLNEEFTDVLVWVPKSTRRTAAPLVSSAPAEGGRA